MSSSAASQAEFRFTRQQDAQCKFLLFFCDGFLQFRDVFFSFCFICWRVCVCGFALTDAAERHGWGGNRGVRVSCFAYSVCVGGASFCASVTSLIN